VLQTLGVSDEAPGARSMLALFTGLQELVLWQLSPLGDRDCEAVMQKLVALSIDIEIPFLSCHAAVLRYNCTSLVSLEISCNHKEDEIGDQHAGHLGSLTHLQRLTLWPVSGMTKAGHAALACLTRLTQLELGSRQEVAVAALSEAAPYAPLVALTGLCSLALPSNALPDSMLALPWHGMRSSDPGANSCTWGQAVLTAPLTSLNAGWFPVARLGALHRHTMLQELSFRDGACGVPSAATRFAFPSVTRANCWCPVNLLFLRAILAKPNQLRSLCVGQLDLRAWHEGMTVPPVPALQQGPRSWLLQGAPWPFFQGLLLQSLSVHDAQHVNLSHVVWLLDVLPNLEMLSLARAHVLQDGAAVVLARARKLDTMSISAPSVFSLHAVIALLTVRHVTLCECPKALLLAVRDARPSIDAARTRIGLPVMDIR
jgi:hypothetical protein